MTRTGRPKLPKGKAAKKVIIFRLTADEDRQIEAAVKASAHKNKSRWIRETLMSAARAQTHA